MRCETGLYLVDGFENGVSSGGIGGIGGLGGFLEHLQDFLQLSEALRAQKKRAREHGFLVAVPVLETTMLNPAVSLSTTLSFGVAIQGPVT